MDFVSNLSGKTLLIHLQNTEMTQHLGYEAYECFETTNARNGRKVKTIHSKYGETNIEVPQNKEGTFEPQIVKKCQKDISAIDAYDGVKMHSVVPVNRCNSATPK